MDMDEIALLKEKQKKSWSLFAPLENFTIIPAANLVNYANVVKDSELLDVGCGTGVVAITAARKYAKVTGIDLSPALIDIARENAELAKVEVNFESGDVESLPFPDDHFDYVLSQFGHMFAPRPQIAIQEMMRVLKPGGVIAFSTWPPDLFVGKLFTLAEKYSSVPSWVSSPSLWGDPHFVRQQLANKVDNLVFHQGLMAFPAISLGHYRRCVETTLGPVIKFLSENKNNSQLIAEFRQEVEELAKEYYIDNYIHQHYLLTRAKGFF